MRYSNQTRISNQVFDKSKEYRSVEAAELNTSNSKGAATGLASLWVHTEMAPMNNALFSLFAALCLYKTTFNLKSRLYSVETLPEVNVGRLPHRYNLLKYAVVNMLVQSKISLYCWHSCCSDGSYRAENCCSKLRP